MTDFEHIEHVVTTSEDGRYSIWPAFRPLPWGWSPEGFRGGRDDCLAHIATVWTELRPRAVEGS